MDLSTAKWFSELEAEDPAFLHQTISEAAIDHRFNPMISAENFLGYPSIDQTSKRPVIKVKNNDSNWCSSSYKSNVRKESSFPPVDIISFGDSNSHVIKSETDVMSRGEIYGSLEYAEPVKTGVTRTPLQALDHILAERKRRQKLSDRFIALSAIVPGLKKLDKASVLGGAIKYLKELEERIKDLENKKKRQNDELSVVSSKRARPSPFNDDTSSSDVDFEGGPDHPSPEINVRISGDNVLIRVCCNNTNGIINEMLREIEKLQLSVTSSSAMPFGNSILSFTVTAQIDGNFGTTAQDLARKIKEAVLKLV